MAKEERIIQTKRNNIIGQNIKCIRKERGMMAIEVITKLELLGVAISASSYTKIERGTNNPTVDFVIAIVKVLNCSYEDVFREPQ